MKKLFVSFAIGTMFLGQALAQQVEVTPATGESWISHLRRPLEQTSMGKTGLLGPAIIQPARILAEQKTARRDIFESEATQRNTVQGADLYRMNCRACHGEAGGGAPPEINSVIAATRGTYAPFTLERLRKLGMEGNRAQANEMANQAKGTLLQRLHKGGTDMPPFPQLSDAEARVIFAYLRQLAEIPGAQNQQSRLQEPSVRIGEHIVKSTCHICHGAVGVNPSPEELMQGTIPPLSTLTARVTLPEFERKVRHGAPIMMGTPLLPYRGRMPVFEYLTETEIADAYLYLKLYPPTTLSDPAEPAGRVELASDITRLAPGEEPPAAPPRSAATTPHRASSPKTTILPLLAEIFVLLLMLGGAIFTVYEVRRSRPGAMKFFRRADDVLDVVQRATSAEAKRVPADPDKQAAWGSRLDLSEHDVFESSWFPRRLKNEDSAA